MCFARVEGYYLLYLRGISYQQLIRRLVNSYISFMIHLLYIYTHIVHLPTFLLPKVATDESCNYDRKRSGTSELDRLAAENCQQPTSE